MESTFNVKTIWNMDEARLKSLNTYMVLCEDAFVCWDLNNLYVYLKSIRRVISGKITKKQLEGLDIKFRGLEKLKRAMDDDDNDDESNPVKFYNKADEIYIDLNRLMKAHGLFFREGRDPTKAALER